MFDIIKDAIGLIFGFLCPKNNAVITEETIMCEISHFNMPSWPKKIFVNGKFSEISCILIKPVPKEVARNFSEKYKALNKQ